GSFSMAAIPPGRYVVFATVDRNTNRRYDYREPFDSTVVTLDSAAEHIFWAFTHDSVGPRIKTLARTDSVTIRVDFNQVLRVEPQDSNAILVAQLPDSTRVTVAAVLTQAVYDSVQAAARAKADSARPPASRA